MSGHSKWSTIRRKKEATDKRRSAVFARLLRAVEVAAREGGGNVEANMTLASAVQKARESSVPNDNIDRAIKRGTGEIEGAKYEEITYEGYAPGGVAVLVEAMTDNRNRTSQEVRHAFTRLGGDTSYSLWVSRPDGTGARQLRGDQRQPYSPPTWSPDVVASGEVRFSSA